MIFDFILNSIYYLVTFMIDGLKLLGTVSPDSNITNGLLTISSYLSPLNSILPLTTIISILIFDLTFEGLYFTYKLIKWGYTKVPGVN